MLTPYAYHLVNVFAETYFGGNPLAVFPQADGLTDQQMQLIARQFNLSETVFVHQTTESSAVRKLRIFTPDYELPFAGHPTIGAAFVLHQQLNLPETYLLQTQAGLVKLFHEAKQICFGLQNHIEVEVIHDNLPQYTQLLGLSESDIAQIAWVNTGSRQLLIQLTSLNALKTCQIHPALFQQIVKQSALYLWFVEQNQANVRLFFGSNGAVVEDPGTGSAAANLGGLCLKNGLTPLNWHIYQGDEIQRPNRLTLQVDESETIYVGGKVIAVGCGELFVPSGEGEPSQGSR